MSSSENHVIFGNDFHLRDLRQVTAAIHHIVEFRGHQKLILDFLSTERAFADAMLPFVALLMKYRSEDVAIEIRPPQNLHLYRIMNRAGWLDLISTGKSGDKISDRDLNLPAKHFHDPDTQFSTLDLLLNHLLQIMPNVDRSHLQALEWTLNEVTDNVLTHAESGIGGLIQMTVKPISREIQFVVSDAGVGVPTSLRPTLGHRFSDEYALEQCVLEGVTRGTGQGNGLYGTIRIATVSKDAFSINSGKAFLSLSRDGRTVVREETDDITGTTIDCTINFSVPLVLEEALSFRGKSHTPADFIDIKYDVDEKPEYVVFLREETRSVGSRLAGRLVRQKILNVYRSLGREAILIDCERIGLMSSSFADELFVKLLQDLGDRNMGYRLKVSNLSEVNLLIIERSRAQRIG